jgi:hypothetical protein
MKPLLRILWLSLFTFGLGLLSAYVLTFAYPFTLYHLSHPQGQSQVRWLSFERGRLVLGSHLAPQRYEDALRSAQEARQDLQRLGREATHLAQKYQNTGRPVPASESAEILRAQRGQAQKVNRANAELYFLGPQHQSTPGFHWDRDQDRRFHPVDAHLLYGFAIEKSPIIAFRTTRLVMPLWPLPFLLCLPFTIQSTITFRRWLRQSRLSRSGLCPSCGYDLRATPERCPECGLVTVAQREDRAAAANTNSLVSTRSGTLSNLISQPPES